MWRCAAADIHENGGVLFGENDMKTQKNSILASKQHPRSDLSSDWKYMNHTKDLMPKLHMLPYHAMSVSTLIRLSSFIVKKKLLKRSGQILLLYSCVAADKKEN